MFNFKKIFYLLDFQERKRAVLLILMIIGMALLDTIGIASILPFMAVLTNPGIIETNLILKYLFEFSFLFGIKDIDQFLFALGVIVFMMLMISFIFKTLTTYLQVEFIQMCEYSFGKRLMEIYLKQPYSWFLTNHSSDIGKNILSEVEKIVLNCLRPLIELIAKGIVTICIICLLLFIDPKLTIFTCFSIGGAYLIIFYSIKLYLKNIGLKRLINNEIRFKSIAEAFLASKLVKVNRLEDLYIKKFSKSSKIYCKTQAIVLALGQLPKFFLELIGFGGVLLIILLQIRQTGNFNDILPILSLYVFAGYRLLPALQQIYVSFTQLSFIGPSVENLLNDFKSLKTSKIDHDLTPIEFKNSIVLKDVDYTFSNSSKPVLKKININIPKNSSVGFIGPSGSGKTTTVDVILGLLEAQNGSLEVDGQIIKRNNIRSWQTNIGYVPQHIYLSDDTIEANIAFGLEQEDIDKQAVIDACQKANLHDFIIDNLPKQYQTKVGENGARLSGGQRQRIGIARALFQKPKIIIFDEATSALDNDTEKIVMEAVNNLSKEKTIILISHRLNTLKNCDLIFKFNDGRIIFKGTYDQLFSK